MLNRISLYGAPVDLQLQYASACIAVSVWTEFTL